MAANPYFPFQNERLRSALAALEQSKYGLRMILLLNERGEASLSLLLSNIPTSPETVLRCARSLEASGLIASQLEPLGRRRRIYALTPEGRTIATQAPTAWVGRLLRNP